MAQNQDVSWKILFRYSRGIVARMVFGGEVSEWLNVELPAVKNPRVDLLARVTDGGLRHVEFQGRNESTMPWRELEYYVGFWRLLGEHVDQIVVYTGREPLTMPDFLETPTIRFRYRILNLREVDGEPLLASDDWGDNVMAILTRADQEKVIQAVEGQIRRLEGQEQADALQTFVILSGIIGLEQQVARRLERDMIDLMENKVLGPMIQRGIEQGLELGRQEGRQEGLHEGMARVFRRMLEQRFGALPAWAKARIDQASADEIDRWTSAAAQADSLQELLNGR